MRCSKAAMKPAKIPEAMPPPLCDLTNATGSYEEGVQTDTSPDQQRGLSGTM